MTKPKQIPNHFIFLRFSKQFFGNVKNERFSNSNWDPFSLLLVLSFDLRSNSKRTKERKLSYCLSKLYVSNSLFRFFPFTKYSITKYSIDLKEEQKEILNELFISNILFFPKQKIAKKQIQISLSFYLSILFAKQIPLSLFRFFVCKANRSFP